MAGGWRFFSMRGFKKLIIIQAAMQNSLRLKGGGAVIWDKILWAWVFNASTEKETESKSSFQSLESVKNHYCCIVWHWSWFESVKNVKSSVWPRLPLGVWLSEPHMLLSRADTGLWLANTKPIMASDWSSHELSEAHPDPSIISNERQLLLIIITASQSV